MITNLFNTTNLGALLMLACLIVTSAILAELIEKIKKIAKKTLTK